MKLIITGPPGAGKSTQAKRVANSLGVTSVSTGDIFRAHVRSRTSLGIGVERYVDTGTFVPDELTNKLIHNRLSQKSAERGFLLDGYPRNIAQATFLDSILPESEYGLDFVLLLSADDDELVSRMLTRAAQSQRSDDTKAIIGRRLELYQQQAEEVMKIYSSQGLLTCVDGGGSIDEVTERILQSVTQGADFSPVLR
ncbi:adenylate kinase [Pseudarthrobacter sulfonivorans]|uniref:adenylate kinase n=1 Tax=Pseudarthrobacter sulfonivorans TaxID=121292 RepID=UPI00277F3C8C|nr:adenylate kinase [Pseudarthrobacter sulfonivorans]MDP9998418.1 adenylate kinase [Pseudarthrobacter sulfonivorans]